MTISAPASNSFLIHQKTGAMATANKLCANEASLDPRVNMSVDRFTKSSPDTEGNKLYSPPLNSDTQISSDDSRRLGASYYGLHVNNRNAQFDDSDDGIRYLSLNKITFGAQGIKHPAQDKYDKFNEFFKQTCIDVLSEKGLMPESGDINVGGIIDIPIKNSEIYDIVNEVTSRVQSDEWGSKMMKELHLDPYQTATRPHANDRPMEGAETTVA